MFQYQIPRSKHRFCIGSMRFGILNGEHLSISKVLEGMNIGCLENHHFSTWVRSPPCVACHEPPFLLWFLPLLPPLPPVEPPWPPKGFHFPFPMIPFTSLRAMKRPRTAWQIQRHAQGENQMDWKMFQTIHPVPMKNTKMQRKWLNGDRFVFPCTLGTKSMTFVMHVNATWNLLRPLICACHHKHECYQQSFCTPPQTFVSLNSKVCIESLLVPFWDSLGLLPLGI